MSNINLASNSVTCFMKDKSGSNKPPCFIQNVDVWTKHIRILSVSLLISWDSSMVGLYCHVLHYRSLSECYLKRLTFTNIWYIDTFWGSMIDVFFRKVRLIIVVFDIAMGDNCLYYFLPTHMHKWWRHVS